MEGSGGPSGLGEAGGPSAYILDNRPAALWNCLSVGRAATGDGSSANGRPTMIGGFDARWLLATIARKSFMSFERPDICASMCCLIWSRAMNERGHHKEMIGSNPLTHVRYSETRDTSPSSRPYLPTRTGPHSNHHEYKLQGRNPFQDYTRTCP